LDCNFGFDRLEPEPGLVKFKKTGAERKFLSHSSDQLCLLTPGAVWVGVELTYEQEFLGYFGFESGCPAISLIHEDQ
jgi:hypothetical protein